LTDLFQMVACFSAVEQCLAINNLSIASALQLSKSGLCNLKLCVALGSMQKFFYPIQWHSQNEAEEAMDPRNKLAKTFTGALYQFSTVRK